MQAFRRLALTLPFPGKRFASSSQFADWLFAQKHAFVSATSQYNQIPPPTAIPEVAFAGRSNVGKSSLISSILGQTKIARTSKTPGATQTVNFFRVGDPSLLYAVDLPGYGYTVAPVGVANKWSKTMSYYLQGRESLKRAFVLIDSRRGLGSIDDEFVEFLTIERIPCQIIMTKVDALKPTELTTATEALRKALHRHRMGVHSEILQVSSQKKIGITHVREAIVTACQVTPPRTFSSKYGQIGETRNTKGSNDASYLDSHPLADISK